MREMSKRVFQVIIAIFLAVLMFYVNLWVSACWLEQRALRLTEMGK
jgi:hypothetical protein